MTNDLPLILNSMANTLKKMEARIARLENEATQFRPQQYGTPFFSNALVRPTEPPSTSIVIDSAIWQGYVLYNDTADASPFGWSKTVLDIADYVGVFDNAYWYRWGILLHDTHLTWADPWAVLEPTSGVTYTDEYETSELVTFEFVYEAFNACNIRYSDAWGGWGADPCVVPVCVFLFRNNGNTTDPGQIEPITLQDTNFSSFLYQDFRPCYTIPCSYVC